MIETQGASRKSQRAVQQRHGPALLTVQAVAEALQERLETTYRRIARGELPAINIGSTERKIYRVRQSDLDNFLAARTLRPGASAQP